MARYRNALPQLGGELFLTDGGLETVMIFHEGIELPLFAAIDMMRAEEGRQKLRDYYHRYADVAARHVCGFVVEAPTWRASPDWGKKLGYEQPELEALNKKAVALMRR